MDRIFGSVIIPVHNEARVLARCLTKACEALPADFELIVIDDASTDGTAEIAARFPCRCFVLDRCRGAAFARNVGAEKAQGEVLVFIDADILVKADSFEKIRALLEHRPDVAAVVGRYDVFHEDPSIFSQYKNLFTWYEYGEAPDYVSWFFTSIGAVRREAFFAVGGFKPYLSSQSGLDDIEFGQRLFCSGYRIRLDKDLTVYHLKRFTLSSFVRNEWTRSKAWMDFVLSRPAGRASRRILQFAQAPRSFLWGVASLCAGLGSAILWMCDPRWCLLTVVCLCLWSASNAKFLLVLAKHLPKRSWIAAVLVLLFDQGIMAAGGLAGAIQHVRSRFRATGAFPP